jgi:hypothetical protein
MGSPRKGAPQGRMKGSTAAWFARCRLFGMPQELCWLVELASLYMNVYGFVCVCVCVCVCVAQGELVHACMDVCVCVCVWHATGTVLVGRTGEPVHECVWICVCVIFFVCVAQGELVHECTDLCV